MIATFAAIGHALAVALLCGWALAIIFFGLAAIFPKPKLRPHPFDVLMEARAIVWAYAREQVA